MGGKVEFLVYISYSGYCQVSFDCSLLNANFLRAAFLRGVFFPLNLLAPKSAKHLIFSSPYPP